MSLESTESSSSSSESSSSSSVDTASIAASVMADVESGGDGSVSTETPVIDTSAAKVDGVDTTQKAVETKTEVDPDDFDAVQAEVTDALGRKRANSIPHPRVKTMIAKAQSKIIAAVAKELGITKAEAELKMEDVTGALTERGTKLKSHEERIAVMDSIDKIMSTDGDRFIRMLAETNPQAYGKFAKVLEQVQQQQQAADDDPEPQPDLPLTDDPNGPKTYSIDQLAKARAWDRRQSKRDALKEVDARFKPIEDERKAVQDAEAQRKADADLTTRVNDAISAQMAKARKWHGFEENSAEILKALQANKEFDIHDAYQHVVIPKIAANRQKQHEELIAEQNKHPKTTSASSSAAATKATDGLRDTASIAREVLREMGG